MFRFENKPNSTEKRAKTKSIISDKRLYRKAIQEEIVEEKPAQYIESLNNMRSIVRILRNEINNQSPTISFDSNISRAAPALKPALVDNKIKRKVADCIRNTYLNSAIQTITENNSSGILNVDALEEDVWWRIGYARAMESLSKQMLGLLISAVVGTLLLQLNKFIKILADGVGSIKVPFTVIIISICINIGIVLKSIVIMFLHYYIYELIRIFEQLPWCYLTYHNEKTGESRTTNIYIDLFGSIVDKGYYPKYTAPKLSNDNNRDYHTTLNQCEASVTKIIRIVGGWTPICDDITIKELKELDDNTDLLSEFINYFRNEDGPVEGVVQKCLECETNCNDGVFESSNGLEKLKTSIATNQMLSAMSAHYIQSDNEGIYNDMSSLLDDIEDSINSQINSMDLYDTLSANMIPSSAMTKLNVAMAKMESALKKVSSFLSSMSSKQFIDLTPSKNKNFAAKTSRDGLLIEQKVYTKQLNSLNKKVAELTNQIEEANKEKSILEEEYYSSPHSLIKKNSIKLIKYEIERLQKSLKYYTTERDVVQQDLDDIEEELKDAETAIAAPAPVDSYRKTLLADASVIFALDMVCCALSLLLNLLSKQYDRDPKAFKEITNSVWYKILAEGKAELIKETSYYVGIQMAVRVIDFIFSVLGGAQMDIDSSASAEFKFEASIDVMAMAMELAGGTAFTSVDTLIKIFNEMIFAQAALLEKPPTWELRKLTSEEKTYFKKDRIPLFGENTFKTIQEIYKNEAANSEYFETPYGLIAFVGIDNPEKKTDETDTKIAIGAYYYEAYEKVYPEDTTHVMTELMSILSSGKCVSLNFIFDYLLGYVKDFHTTLLIFKILLEYEPKFNIHAVVNYKATMKFTSFNVFSDLLKLLIDNLDFFIKLCNLELQVDDISELNAEINKMVEENIDSTKQEARIFEGTYAPRSAVMMDPDNYDEEEYLSLIEEEYNLPVSINKKIKYGILSPRAERAWNYIQDNIIVENTSRIDENIIGGTNG